MVDTYGVPNYKEINPAVITAVTFPFLFGLMFGDVAHGALLLLFGLYIRQYLQHSWFHKYWCLLSLMGFFSLSAGLVYNEFFSVPLLVQPSCYHRFLRKSPDCVYGLGLDWVWFQSNEEINFVNSFKMKFSVIVGVALMLLGVSFKGLNSVFFRK